MSKFNPGSIRPAKFLAIKKYKSGSEVTVEYFHTQEECISFIKNQPQPKTDEWFWCVGKY